MVVLKTWFCVGFQQLKMFVCGGDSDLLLEGRMVQLAVLGPAVQMCPLSGFGSEVQSI